MILLQALLAQVEAAPTGLTIGGMIMMGLSIGGVLALNAFCLKRLLRGDKPGEDHHAPLEIDTHDLDD